LPEHSASLHPFTLLFIATLLVSVGLRFWLAGRQVRHVARHRSAVPEAFSGRIGLAAHQRAADYTIARVRLGIVETALTAALLLAFTLLGGLQILLAAAAALFPEAPLLAGIVFVALAAIASALVDLPLEAWRRFRLEQRFGFNRMTPRLFIVDQIKGALVGAALGLPLLALVLWLMAAAGEYWWLWAWLVWMGFNLAVMVLFPTVIAPLFNRFEPLPAGEVRDRVHALLVRCGFKARGLFVMDGSRRSAHGNAYFTGLGRGRRIVFFDTLLARLNVDEIEAVLAHELGHFRLRHIPRRIAASFALSLGALWLLGWLSRQPWFYQALGLTPEPAFADAAALVLFFLVLPVFAFPLQPLFALLSRRHEFEADAFAAAQTDARHLSSALVKLYEDNASTLTPDPIHSAFHDSHPPAVQRLGRLMASAHPT
jgi:STE24 endopeptidase